jgi:hypothetical protein
MLRWLRLGTLEVEQAQRVIEEVVEVGACPGTIVRAEMQHGVNMCACCSRAGG